MSWEKQIGQIKSLTAKNYFGFPIGDLDVFYVATILPKVEASAQIFKTFGGNFKADCFCYISFNLSTSPEIKRDVGIKEK